MSFSATLWPERLERRLVSRDGRAFFELDGPFLGQEVRRGDRLLHVEPPVDDADDALRDEADDARAARRADEKPQPPLLVEQHRRRHARQRPLPAFDAVGYRPAVDRRHVGEVRQLIVQDEPADHQLTAERALHARRHRDPVAEAVDDRKVARRRPLRRSARRKLPSRRRQGLARRDRGHRFGGIDERGARAQIARSEEPGDRRRHELRVPQVEIAIGKGEPVGLGKQVNRLRRLLANVRQLEAATACRALAASSRRPTTVAADRRRATTDTACTAAARRWPRTTRDPAASFALAERCCRGPRRRWRPRARPCASAPRRPPRASSSAAAYAGFRSR